MTEQETIEEPQAAAGEAADAPDGVTAAAAGNEPEAPATTALEEAVVDAAVGDQATPTNEEEVNGRTYDFTRPWTISNKFHHNLTSIAEAFASQLSFNTSNYLRTSVDVTYNAVKQELFKDHITQVPERACFGVFSFQPVKGQSVIAMDSRLIFAIMERLIGGEGKTVDVERDFTEIETRVFMVVLGKMLGDLRDASKKFFTATAQLSRIESNPAFIAVMTPAEKVISMKLEMTIGETQGNVLVAFPMSGFDAVLPALDPKDEAMIDRSEISPENLEKISSALSDSTVEVAAELGGARISLAKLRELREGDTIILDRPMTEPIAIKAGTVSLCRAEPGKSQNRKAVKLVSGIGKEV